MSQAREAQYKSKGRSKGLESRLKGKARDSKRQREELLSGRRRAALLEINEEIMEEEGIQEKGTGVTSKKKTSDDRKEELLKWKKERDRKKQKEQEKANVKPAFVVGRANISSNRKVPPPVEPISTAATVKEGPPSKKGGKRATEAPGDTKREELGRKRATGSRQLDKVQKPATRSSTRLQTAKSKETKGVKQPNKKPSTAKSSKSTNSKREITKEPSPPPPPPAIDKSDLPRDSVLSSAWVPGALPTPQCASQSARPNFDQFFSKQLFSPFQFKGQTRGETSADKSRGIFTFRKEFREEDIIKSIEDDSICSESNIEEEKMEEKEAAATDNTDRGKSGKKGEVEGGGRKRNLKKRQNERTEKESDNEEDLETTDTGTKMGREEEPVDELPTNIRMSDTSIEAINVSVAHNNNYTNQQLEEERQSSTDPPANAHTQDLSPPIANFAPPTTDVTPPSEGLATDATGNDSGFDLAPFYKLHADVTQRFNELCAEWNEKLSRLEDNGEKEEDAGRPSDEVIDDIRTTVCQAKLLMRQKLKQYLELVQQAEDPTAEHKTMAEDLQGFWDMVYFQVENIYKKFSSFAEMESNSWKAVVAPADDGDSVKPRRSKRGASKAKRGSNKTGASSAVSERLKAARAKREAERLKIREMRQAFAASKTKDEEEEQEEVSAPVIPERKDDVTPIPDLISFSPSSLQPPTTRKSILKTPQSASKLKTSSIKRLSSIPDPVFELDESHDIEGAFTTKLVQINASKKMIKDFDTNLIMSPARRSKRLSTRRRSELVISSISEIPNDRNNVAYLPNKALID